MLSIIIPANNEAEVIGTCLDAVLSQRGVSAPVEIIVVANACTDGTVAAASAFTEAAGRRGWPMTVLDITEGGKANAMNRGDDAAAWPARLYLDADVTIEPGLLAGVCAALACPEPVYCGGVLKIIPPRSRISRLYADIWTRLPFMASPDTKGAGLYAVNEAGRARWGRFYTGIRSDDGYVRLLFAPHERRTVPVGYLWPLPEGFGALVRVRRRNDFRLAATLKRFPHLRANAEARLGVFGHLRLILSRPLGYGVYAAVRLAAAARNPGTSWPKGR